MGVNAVASDFTAAETYLRASKCYSQVNSQKQGRPTQEILRKLKQEDSRSSRPARVNIRPYLKTRETKVRRGFACLSFQYRRAQAGESGVHNLRVAWATIYCHKSRKGSQRWDFTTHPS